MLKHLYLIFIATFILGFATGVILFLQANVGQEESETPSEASQEGFTITAYMYGGCERGGGCPSYQIENEGSYTYVVRRQESGETKYEDMLSKKQYTALQTLVSETKFDTIMDTTFTETCPVASDGVAYRYDILYNGKRFSIDSCLVKIDNEILFRELQNYFKVFWLLYSGESAKRTE